MKKNRKVNCRAVPITAGIIAGESDPLFSTTCVLPEQFFSLPNPAQSEKKLMLAVLEDAVHCLSYFTYKSARARRLAQEAKDWFESKEERLLFSFIRICAELKSDHDYVRVAILRPYRTNDAKK